MIPFNERQSRRLRPKPRSFITGLESKDRQLVCEFLFIQDLISPYRHRILLFHSKLQFLLTSSTLFFLNIPSFHRSLPSPFVAKIIRLDPILFFPTTFLINFYDPRMTVNFPLRIIVRYERVYKDWSHLHVVSICEWRNEQLSCNLCPHNRFINF